MKKVFLFFFLTVKEKYMKAVSAENMRLLDSRTISEAGISGETLMRTAGTLCASLVMEYIAELSKNEISIKVITILAGKGNNAGDAFVAAKILYDTGRFAISLHCMVKEDVLTGEALTMFRELPEELKKNIRYDLTKEDLISSDLILDGLLGTGIRGGLRGDYGKWIDLANGSDCHIVAIDVPSGMDSDTGRGVSEEVIRADLTLTIANPKIGMLTEEGAKHCGRIRVLDIGIPGKFVDALASFTECTTFSDVKKSFQKEEFHIHKNSRGHVLVLGGSSLYSGAPLLAGEGALRTGAGLVSVAVPEKTKIFGNVPKALMIRELSGTPEGFFSSESIRETETLLQKADTVVLGPGMGQHPKSFPFLQYILQQEKCVVADADAINLIAQKPELLKEKKCTLILTPHEGEMKRLEKAFSLESTLSRQERAITLAKKIHAYLILKGVRTLVCTPEGKYAVNLTATPALATAGSGDVLAGITGALLHKKEREEEIFQALRSAVFLHGLAGELSNPSGSRGVISDDLLSFIAPGMRKISPKA